MGSPICVNIGAFRPHAYRVHIKRIKAGSASRDVLSRDKHDSVALGIVRSAAVGSSLAAQAIPESKVTTGTGRFLERQCAHREALENGQLVFLLRSMR